MKNNTINKKEIEKFSKIAEEWWDPNGKFKPLHKFNPIRIKYIRDTIVSGEYETDNEEGCNALDYLEDVLDINYYVDQKKEYLGARVLVAFGGPNIWIDTKHQEVEGYWGGDKEILYYHKDEMDIDGALREIFACT